MINQNKNGDIIAAIATPPGTGGVGIVRVSGFNLTTILQGILGISEIKPRYAYFSDFLDKKKQIIDQGIALYFKAPHSFTGEDVLEFQGHGGTIIMDMLLQRVLELGARMARPGEFSERAFLNGKIDLAQAEAVADLIHANSELAAKAAIRSLQGEFSKIIQELVDELISLRVYVEAAIDFSDEEIEFLPQNQIKGSIEALLERLRNVQDAAKQGELLQRGANVVIAGPPNSGKSSLINQLSQKNVAIVTRIPGTTRDLIKQQIQIDGLYLQIMDTAGIRNETVDPIEEEGIRRARKAIKHEANHVLLVLDVRQAEDWKAWLSEIPDRIPVTLILNKIDLVSKPEKIESCLPIVHISAKTGEGIDALKKQIKICLGLDNVPENQFIARRRHLEALDKAFKHLLKALAHFSPSESDQPQSLPYELVAEDLKLAQEALSDITGGVSSDDLLGKIFESFCVGK